MTLSNIFSFLGNIGKEKNLKQEDVGPVLTKDEVIQKQGMPEHLTMPGIDKDPSAAIPPVVPDTTELTEAPKSFTRIPAKEKFVPTNMDSAEGTKVS